MGFGKPGRLARSLAKPNRERKEVAELGFIDGIVGDELLGWFASPKNPDAELVIVANGEIVASVAPFTCTEIRQDVANLRGVDETCGFRVRLSGLAENTLSEISVLHQESGFDFGGQKIRYCPRVGENAELLRRLFQAEFYRYRYGHEKLSNREAFDHYLQFGIFENLEPNPWFSSDHVIEQLLAAGIDTSFPILDYVLLEKEALINPSPVFDTRFYAAENPDVGKVFGYLEHYVLHGHKENRARLPTALPDHVRDELHELSEFDHDLEYALDYVDRVVRFSILSPHTYIPRLTSRLFPEPLEAVVCVNSLTLGGAELIATYVMKALSEHYGAEAVLMIVTDSSDVSLRAMLGDEANIVFLNEEGNAQSATDQINLLHAVVGELKPSRVININSRTAWGMYRTYGKQLSRFTELDANLFCFDYDEKGRVFGYIKEYIPECLKYLTHIMCDNQQVISDIRDHYGFTDEEMSKFQTVYVPAPSATATIEIDQAGFADKPVLWSGRLANQKRPELLLEIAEARPDIKFIAYGPPGDSDISDRITRNEIPNIDYRGVYTDITELDLSEYLCYLNTSAWEGLPTMIIQVMSAGLPVVTPLVGGIGELVDDTSGWIVEDGDSANAYVSNLIELLAQPHQARQRATQGKALINQRHEWGAYKQRLKEIGLLKNKGLLSSMNVLSFTRGLFRRTG